MAVVVQYIVERNGIQKMTFSDKKEADAYDKELEISENMSALLVQLDAAIDESQMEELCLFLARHKEEALAILKGSKPKTNAGAPPSKDKPAKAADNKKAAPESVENKDKSNKSKSKAA